MKNGEIAHRSKKTKYGSIAVCHSDLKLTNFLALRLVKVEVFDRVLKFGELADLISVLKQNEIEIILIQANIRRYDFETILKAVLKLAPKAKVVPIFAPIHPGSAAGEVSIWRTIERALDITPELIYGFDEDDDNEYAIALKRYREAEPVQTAIRLSPREMEVLIGICLGKTGVEIGKELFIAADTVKSHIKRIYRKLEVRTRAGAMLAAHRNGLLDVTQL
jgi:DNA-binding CsgD family transcriptional regulator